GADRSPPPAARRLNQAARPGQLLPLGPPPGRGRGVRRLDRHPPTRLSPRLPAPSGPRVNPLLPARGPGGQTRPLRGPLRHLGSPTPAAPPAHHLRGGGHVALDRPSLAR